MMKKVSCISVDLKCRYFLPLFLVLGYRPYTSSHNTSGITARYVVHPFLVVQVPAYRLLDTLFKLQARFPAVPSAAS